MEYVKKDLKQKCSKFQQERWRNLSVLSTEIRNLKRMSIETFKRRLDRWLKSVLDEPKIENYAMYLAAENNIIVNQAGYKVSTPF